MYITVAQFLARPLEALSFYDILPSDGVVLVDSPVIPPVANILAQLRISDSDIDEQLLDAALLALLSAPDLDTEAAVEAADHVSRLYSALLAGGKRDRGRRMKLQQVNFFLRDLIDRDADATGTAETIASAAPWDWLPLDGGAISIVSGSGGLRWTQAGRAVSADVGYPSQLDRIDAERVSVGSIFSAGATIWTTGGLIPVQHERPVVIVLHWAGRDLAVSYDGAIFDLARGDIQGYLDVQQVDRIRQFGSTLVVSDWSRPDQVTVCDLEGLRQERVPLAPVILLNDICKVGERYYVICKQQGRVFAFDSSFGYLDERLSFGRGARQLFDPLSLRFYDGILQIRNWVTATRVCLPAF